jgi:hypothetical protein
MACLAYAVCAGHSEPARLMAVLVFQSHPCLVLDRLTSSGTLEVPSTELASVSNKLCLVPGGTI